MLLGRNYFNWMDVFLSLKCKVWGFFAVFKWVLYYQTRESYSCNLIKDINMENSGC